MDPAPDTRFDWLVTLPCWGIDDDGCESIEIAQADLVARSGLSDWRFAFVSWASARLIRTGEWYEAGPCCTRHGVELLCIVRDTRNATSRMR